MKIFLTIIIAFSMSLLWKMGNQNYEESRDIHVAQKVQEIDDNEKFIFENKKFSIAEQLCLSWVGKRKQVNCSSGRKLQIENFNGGLFENLDDYLSQFFLFENPIKQVTNKKKAFLNAVDYCQYQIERLGQLRKKLGESSKSSLSISTLTISLDHKIKYANDELIFVKSRLVENDIIKISDYKKLFNLLLYLEGYNYSSSSGEFKKLTWDISRAFDENQSYRKKVEINTFFNEYSLIFLVILPVFIFIITASPVSVYSNVCLISALFFMSLGLIFASDASIHFAKTSTFFEINPLGNQISRQSLVLLIGYIALLFGFYSINIFQKLLFTVDRNIKRSCFFGISLVGISYGIISPALGSEFLKFVVVVFAAITTFRHAKESFLVKKYLLKKNQFFRFFKAIFLLGNDKKKEYFATEFISHYIFKSFLSLIIVSAVTLILSALVFGDLGGALILTLILIVLVFLLFGSKLAFMGISILLLLSLVLLTTKKVQERLNLMLEPMYASVSDFARLIGFTEASGDDGYGISKIPWCSNEGICLPLQVLSDYMPTLIYGTLGSNIALLIFVAYCLLFMVILSKCIYLFLISEENYKLATIFVFYFATAYLIQTLITFFGNMRIIPLTGLSMPFMSIGLSSTVFPCFILGMFMRLSPNKAQLKK